MLWITPSVSKVVEFVKPWIENENHVVFIGDKGVGKNIIAEETILKTGMTVRVNCTPQTSPSNVIALLKSSCALISSGISKVMKSPSNHKLIIYIKHLELLKSDKWRSKSLIAFLTQLICYNGFYDELTFEWIQLHNCQIVCTCDSLKQLDKRFVSVANIVNVEMPPLNEVVHILSTKINDNCNYNSQFSNAFLKIVESVERNIDLKNLDLFRIGIEIISSLKHHNEVDTNVLRHEFDRAFQFYIDRDILENALTLTFGAKDNNIVYASLNGSSKLTKQSVDQFKSQIRKSLSAWVNETEVKDPSVALIPETISLFSEVNFFLADDDEYLLKALVLVGLSGCGKKLTTRVISHSFNYDVIWSPKLALNEKQLSAELKALLQEDDRSDKKILLLIDEIHIKLMPHLRDKIYAIMHDMSINSMVRVILTLNTLDSVSKSMWSRMDNCHIHLISKWSNESRTQLAHLIIPQFVKDEQFSLQFYKIYEQFASVSSDPRRYISFIHTYHSIIDDKLSSYEKLRQHLKLGVSKLDEASHSVEKLKAEAVEQKQLLAKKRSEADDALNLITSSMHASEDQKVELELIKSNTEKETTTLRLRKREIDAELKQIEPVLMAAKASVGAIKSESLAEIRSLRAPPEVIRDILEGVLRLMGVNDTSWVSMKSFLSRRGVKDEIMNFESRKITPNMREKVEILLQNRGESYEASVAKRASVAAAPLAEWVKANVSYSRVLHKIKPLEEELSKLESGLKLAMSRMNSLTTQLEGVETEVGSLRDRLNQTTLEAAQIEIGLNQTEKILSQSEKLIADLSGEFKRWTEQLSEIDTNLQALPLNSIIAAAYIVYCSNESSSEKKQQLLEKCCQVLNVDLLNITQFLNFSSEEDIFLSVKTPHLCSLICDPSRKVMSKFNNCEMTDMRNRDWIKVMELCLRFGRTLIINDFCKLDFSLLSILRHEIFGAIESRNWIYIGDKRVDYNQNFKIYFVTQDINCDNLTNPLFNVINLSPNDSSLTSTLLSLVIQSRKPELEIRKNELEKDKQYLEQSLRKLEENLLNKLSQSTGNILNDLELVSSLKDIKTSALQIEQSLTESAKLTRDLNTKRAEYESLAAFASKIYFYIRELINLNNMYHIGVAEYESVFTNLLSITNELTTNQLLQELYNYVSRGLFPEDKEIFRQFLIRQCPKESKLLEIEEKHNTIRHFVRSAHERQQIALIMASPGSDPSSELREIGEELSPNGCVTVSMGSDVIESAQQLLESTDDSIKCVCLSNLHLVMDWLPKLTHILSHIMTRATKKSVMLVSECDSRFPISLLEMTVKMAYKSAPGLQSQLKRLSVERSVKSTPELRILSYLHAICCERLHFVPQGWTKCYEFGFNDFRCASNVVQTVLQTKERRLRFDFIRGLLATVIYGGKIDTKVDYHILDSLIRRWFTTSNDNESKSQDEISLLGLSANVNTLRQVFVNQRLIKGLRVLEKATNYSEIGEQSKRLRLLWKELAANKLMNDMPATNASHSGSLPLQAYTSNEFSHTQQLIRRIDNDLTAPDSDAYQQLINNEVPDSWLHYWPHGPESVEQFLRSTAATANHIQTSMHSIQSMQASLSSMRFQLCHSFHPNSLLNALRQEACRELRVSIDCVEVYCSWSSLALTTSRSMRAGIDGIMIEGAQFDGRSLQSCQQDSPLQSQMPPLSLYFLAKDSPAPYDKLNDVISLPLYSTSARQSVIVWLDVPCDRQSQSQWIQCAASLVIKY